MAYIYIHIGILYTNILNFYIYIYNIHFCILSYIFIESILYILILSYRARFLINVLQRIKAIVYTLKYKCHHLLVTRTGLQAPLNYPDPCTPDKGKRHAEFLWLRKDSTNLCIQVIAKKIYIDFSLPCHPLTKFTLFQPTICALFYMNPENRYIAAYS